MTSLQDNRSEPFKLEEVRDRIDQLDQQIIALLAERFQLTESVGHYKAQHKLEAQDIARETLQFKKIIQLSEQAVKSGVFGAGIQEDYRYCDYEASRIAKGQLITKKNAQCSRHMLTATNRSLLL